MTVVDLNDNSPKFPMIPRTIAILDDAQTGSLVVNLNTTPSGSCGRAACNNPLRFPCRVSGIRKASI